ncbi:DBF4-type zinc finger-containing protein 2 [Stegastes partitus]|uniref:DBF4-type zinc finger-containing protein 2 n=1 Tax=Stegastes partitus TaxID=144197 RepID=A0A9Y4TQJ7_9TELE|nr:PREDICTED: serine/arginine repetitive matrix protein 2-like [Stegastes partitus]
MGFGDLKSASGLKVLNDFMSERSYIEGSVQHNGRVCVSVRPSHADLPSVSAPPLPRAELDELRFSDEDSRSRGTREHLPSSDDASCQGANQQQEDSTRSQSGERANQERLSAQITQQEEGGTHLPQAPPPYSQTPAPQRQTPPPHCQAPPSVHRKAHRKTNRRKTSDSSASSQPHRGPGPDQELRPWTPTEPRLQTLTEPRPRTLIDPRPRTLTEPSPWTPTEPRPRTPTEPRPRTLIDPRTRTLTDPSTWTPTEPRPRTPTEPRPRTLIDPRPWTLTEPRPWLSWQKERREAHKEEAFSSDHSDPLDQTIEEVIQVYCHGVSSTPCQQEDTESFHVSLPTSMETHSDDWDSPLQVVLQRGHALSDTPVQVSHTEGQDLSRLMDVQVDLEDQVYSYQLDSALHSDGRPGGGARQDQGFWTLPIEEVLPAPERIPESFRGKSWAQIEQEDEEKVERLVQQFRRGRFLCYFDSESLARYGRRNKNKGRGQSKEAEPDPGVLPLLEQPDSDSVYVRRKRRGRTRSCRLASRCQVVKVSHSTQTVRLVVPAVHQLTVEAPPSSIPAANQEAAERTPEAQAWRCLPSSYYNIITPVQPRTSLVYLLCSPSGPAPACTPSPGSAPKRCRKKRRPLDQHGLKVKYKQLPVRFYEPGTNRILKNAPKGFLWRRGSAPTGPPPSCVRQLFRSLSPDLNTDRPAAAECAAGSSRVKGQQSPDPPFSNSSFLLSTLRRGSAETNIARRRGRMSQAPPSSLDSRSERGRGGRRERTRPPASKRRTRAQATPPQPRREGLRRAGLGRKLPGSTGPAPLSAIPPSSRRGRGRRGRGGERGRR